MIILPTICENGRGSDIFSSNLEKGIITLSGEINDQMAASITSQLLYLESKGRDDVYLYINSPGGEVSAGLAIYDTMKYIKNDVATVCLGMAASMGAVIFSGGTPGKRLILPHSEVMIHQPIGGRTGQASDIRIAAEHILNISSCLAEILAENCGKEKTQILEDMDRDRWMNAEAAVKYGIADKILLPRTREIA